MASRLELHSELCQIMGNENVYFQPPPSRRMSYPCIRYEINGVWTDNADNINYKIVNNYDVIVIDPDPDRIIYLKILRKFKMVKFLRSYVSNNLNHYVLSLYY